MTCYEKLKKDHPDWNETEIEASHIYRCPSDLGYLCDDRELCDKFACEACWEREIPEIQEGTAHGEIDIPEEAKQINNASVILDSGDRTEFSSGAVRDMRAGKGRCDLMPLEVAAHCLIRDGRDDQVLTNIRSFQRSNNTDALYIALAEFNKQFPCVAAGEDDDYTTCTMLLEVAKHFEEGAKKYGESNWQKGIPIWCYIDSAVRHYLKWLRGDDDENHANAFVWNLMCCIWEVDYSSMQERNSTNEQ